MSILDDLKSLDPNDPGRWPLPVRVGTVVLCFVILSALLFWAVVYKDKKPQLVEAQQKEEELRKTYKEKHSKAVNLAVYQQQLADIERSFGALLRQLPGRTEVPNLLVDISQVGVGAGLEEKLFQPSSEIKKDFYAELPIKIKLTGSYHQMGEFVSGIAALPRIVTLHDITIKPDDKDAYDVLSFELTAKTFRYLDDTEVAAEKAKAAEPEKGKKGKAKPKPKADADSKAASAG
jgi:type IV pilus assembly protein PilO